jgi:phosphoribosyl 1,2-cyclic phosphodiesterase
MVRVCTLFSGSSGNCTYIENGSSGILIDAGGSAKKIIERLTLLDVSIHSITGIFITHEHIDHIAGVKAVAQKRGIPIIANERTLKAILGTFPDIDTNLFVVINTGEKAACGDFEVNSFATPHDGVESVGYVIKTANKKITVATDLGHINETFIQCSKNSDMVLLEANYDDEMLKNGNYPMFLQRRISCKNGHLSNFDSANAVISLVENGTKNVLLAHLSKDNNTPAKAYDAVNLVLSENKIAVSKDVQLNIAPRFEVSKVSIL